eukprot:6214028-Pleurochrysis_carterae.AAC.3
MNCCEATQAAGPILEYRPSGVMTSLESGAWRSRDTRARSRIGRNSRSNSLSRRLQSYTRLLRTHYRQVEVLAVWDASGYVKAAANVDTLCVRRCVGLCYKQDCSYEAAWLDK